MENTETNVSGASRKRLNALILKPSEFEAGQTIVKGKLTGEWTRHWEDPVDGKQVELDHLVFDTLQGTVKVRMDAGMKNAIAEAGVNVGDTFEIVKMEQKKMKNGNPVNQYDIYAI